MNISKFGGTNCHECFWKVVFFFFGLETSSTYSSFWNCVVLASWLTSIRNFNFIPQSLIEKEKSHSLRLVIFLITVSTQQLHYPFAVNMPQRFSNLWLIQLQSLLSKGKRGCKSLNLIGGDICILSCTLGGIYGLVELFSFGVGFINAVATPFL